MTQLNKLKKLLKRKAGATSLDIIKHVCTVTPSRRIADLRDMGWEIKKVKVPGKNYFRYFGREQK